MAKEVIVINEPDEIAKDFEEGTLLNVEGKVLKVEEDTRDESGCDVCVPLIKRNWASIVLAHFVPSVTL